MSLESAKSFFEKVKTDDNFQAKLKEESDNKRRQQMIKDAGFDFTEEEWKTVRDSLGDDELDQVAGGHCWHHCCDFSI